MHAQRQVEEQRSQGDRRRPVSGEPGSITEIAQASGVFKGKGKGESKLHSHGFISAIVEMELAVHRLKVRC
jgi:hypothetical protein